MNYFREYFSARKYFRSWGQALLVAALGLALMFLSKVFGGAVVLGIGVVVTFVGMALIPSMGYRDSERKLMGPPPTPGGAPQGTASGASRKSRPVRGYRGR